MCDLRGYGDSSKPPDGDNHANYSKRPMALDGVEVMQHLGYNRFPVVGHDRGGRVGRRLALDHPDKVSKLAVLDIVPAHYLYSHATWLDKDGQTHTILEFVRGAAPSHAVNHPASGRAPRLPLGGRRADSASRVLCIGCSKYSRWYFSRSRASEKATSGV